MNHPIRLALLVSSLAFATGASAQDPPRELRIHALGARIAYVRPDDLGSTIGFGAHADIGDVVPGVALVPNISFWSRTDTGRSGTALFDLTVREFGAGTDARKTLRSTGKTEPYFGAGVGIFFLDELPRTDLAETRSRSTVGLGLSFLAGLGYELSPSIDLQWEARYKIGNAEVFQLSVGLQAGIEE